MNVENKFARLMRNTGPMRFFVPVGIILIVFGVIMLNFNTDNYIETTGKIISVVEGVYDEDETPQYDVEVKYTVDNKEYSAVFGGMSGDFKVGEDMKLFYDPANPEKATNSKTGFLPLILIAVGALSLILGVYKTVTAFKKSKELDNVVGGQFPSFDGFKDMPGVTEYYCRFDGKTLKPGYILEDAGRKILFEGKMTKQALIGARTFEFNNHISGIVEEHEVGHTVTQTYNDELFSAKSWFKFDGKNIWDVLHDRGIRLSTNLHSKFPNCIYDVTLNSVPFAKIETCGVHVHEDDAAQHKINIPVGRWYYRFWTASSDFDTLFLTIFAISETEQAVVE